MSELRRTHPIRADETGVLIRAIAFAAGQHRSQRRKDVDASPYINHPIALANVLANEGGIEDLAVLCAAVLHDTIEDTTTTQDELERLFGAEIAAIVAEVTDDMTLDTEDRKRLQIEHAPHLSPKAKLVKLADKICNVRDVLDNPPHRWSASRRRQYCDQADAVVAGLRGTNGRLEAIFDGLQARRAELA